MPVNRFMQTRVDQLRDALTYARPAALHGYGALDAKIEAYLALEQRRLRQRLSEVAYQIERPAHTLDLDPGLEADLSLPAARWNIYQRRALAACLHASLQEALAATGLYDLRTTAHISGLPVAYTAAEVAQLLAATDQLARHFLWKSGGNTADSAPLDGRRCRSCH